ncbi:type II toxin-antitoxin system VapC family toxin [Nocardia sp. NBC_01730]|uniref:type II toxin-antitoxin system VapC family toxin n=1 Tax=Nocardia sp. NBC_01730 TaxID=2975998 RepID=UPI002E0E53C8|nr:type II toxin-antitoxin system VapC family toxin [Nocardia sp. NBC_01730]
MLLLDSQTALWVLDDNPRLGVAARKAITSATEVYVSVATIWELTIKSMLGKLSVPTNLTDTMSDQGLGILDVTGQHAEGLREFPELVRHDPFDRLITAQALCERLSLLTADSVLLGLGRNFIVDSTQ